MVGNDEDGPTPVQQRKEPAQIPVGGLIDPLDEGLVDPLVGVVPGLQGLAQMPDLVPGAVHVVEVAEDHLIAVFLNKAVQTVGLPGVVQIPAGLEDLGSQLVVLSADEAHRGDVAHLLHHLPVERFGMPQQIIRDV